MKIITHMKPVNADGSSRFIVKLPKDRLDQVYLYKYGATTDVQPYLQLNYFTEEDPEPFGYYWVGGFKANFYPTKPKTTEYFETIVDVGMPTFVFDHATRHMEDVTWVLWEIEPTTEYACMVTSSDYKSIVVPTYNSNNWGIPYILHNDDETYIIKCTPDKIYVLESKLDFISIVPIYLHHNDVRQE